MTREIKFRAWDKVAKKMSEPFTLYDIAIHYDNGFAICGDNYLGMDDDDADVVVMQLIGLHDKNGKEIYEGDIVKYNFPSSWKGHKSITIEVKWQEIGNILTPNGVGFPMIHTDFIDYGEVIGNIYENPELMQKEGQ